MELPLERRLRIPPGHGEQPQSNGSRYGNGQVGKAVRRREEPTGLACPNAANVANSSATLSAFADLNWLHNSPAVAGLGRAARAERTTWACSARVLGQGFFCLPRFAGSWFVCDAEGGKKTLNAE
jgi:hypothetical protein